MKRSLIKFAGTLLAAYVALCLLLFTAQRSFLYFPTRAGDTRSSTFTLQSGDASLRISSRPHDGPKALIYFGGNAENVAHTLPQFAKAFPDHAIFMPHYRGYGGSSGQPSESALHHDAMTLLELVQAKHTEVILVGRSLGSGLAVRLAAVRPVNRLVLITPYDSILNLAKQKLPFLPVRWLLVDTFESWRFAPLVNAPTMILAASHDEIIPMESTRALFQAFPPGVATMRIIAGTDHNSVSNNEEFMNLLGEQGASVGERGASAP